MSWTDSVPARYENPGEIAWVLLRAFGPVDQRPALAFDSGRLVELADLLDLSPRIAARQGPARLESEIGVEAAGLFRARMFAAAAGGLRLLDSSRIVGEAACAAGVPIAFLKFVALELTGVVKVECRSASDIDVLAPAATAERLQAELIRRGFESAGSPEYEHQLPMLRNAGGALVEVHVKVPGVRIDGRRSATLEALREFGCLGRLEGWMGDCFVPDRRVLLAHALVHGLAQHGAAPWSYPPMRVVADVVDLEAARAGDSPVAVDVAAVMPWIARDLQPGEVLSMQELCKTLVSGSYRDHELVRHAVAGLTDEAYKKRLKVIGLGGGPSDWGPAGRTLRTMREALVLSRTQIDRIYGPPGSGRWGYAARRAMRPFDLAWRMIRYVAATVAFRAGERTRGLGGMGKKPE